MQKLIANDPETRSADIVADNIEHLKALFPEAFTEDKIDFEVLKQLLGGEIADREEKYGLNWHGKRRARQLALTPSTGTLRPCPQESVDWDTTQNLMIEGDNLEVLKLLQKSYAGKVKLIYIDPPYNTGKDFVYPDDYRDSMRNDHLNALVGPSLIQSIRVIGSVPDESLRSGLDPSVFQGGFYEGDFVRRSTLDGYGDRKTRAVCHCHELRTFAPLGRTRWVPPFFAATNRLSMKHSLTSRPLRSCKSCARGRRICSKVPSDDHRWNRRWQVW